MALGLRSDNYTSIPKRTFGRRRSRCDSHQALESSDLNELLHRFDSFHMVNLSRSELLDKLHDTIYRDQEEIEALLARSGTNLPTVSLVSASNSGTSLRDTGNVLGCLPLSDGRLDVLNKNDYLLTPLRTKFFPKASPSVLKYLLRSPSIRAPTPEPDCASPGDFSLRLPAVTYQAPGTPASSRSPSPSPDRLSYAKPLPSLYCLSDVQAAAIPPLPFSASAHSLPPSPPPSTKLPSLDVFSPVLDLETSPYAPHFSRPAQADPHAPASHCRSLSHGCLPGMLLSKPRVKQPLSGPTSALAPSDVFTSGSLVLRAAPCSPLVTRAVADAEDFAESNSPSSVPTGTTFAPEPAHAQEPGLPPVARGARGGTIADPRRLMPSGLALGVVRNFQRVLAELQGLGHEPALADHASGSDDAHSRGADADAGDGGGALLAAPEAPVPRAAPSSSGPCLSDEGASCHPSRSLYYVPAGEAAARAVASGSSSSAVSTGIVTEAEGPGEGAHTAPVAADTQCAHNDTLGMRCGFPGLPMPLDGLRPCGERRYGFLGPSASAESVFAAPESPSPSPSPSPPPPQCPRARDNHATRLLAQAAEEEAQARELREIADKLDELARCRRLLARARL